MNPKGLGIIKAQKMTKKELTELFRLAEKLYEQERKKAGVSVLPYAWAENKKTGAFLVISTFGVFSKKIKALLERSYL